jgi:hypothetical protein
MNSHKRQYKEEADTYRDKLSLAYLRGELEIRLDEEKNHKEI